MGRGSVGMLGDLSKFAGHARRLFQHLYTITQYFFLNYGSANFKSLLENNLQAAKRRVKFSSLAHREVE